MNRRTAEHRTAEYRSEKDSLLSFKNFCGSKFLIRYSKLHIHHTKGTKAIRLKV
jgi:hypothetical protein